MHRYVQVFAGAALALTSVALANPSGNLATVVVEYHDLDLSSEPGARVLLERIEQAAAQACRNPRISNLLSVEAEALLRAYRTCTEKAVRNTVTRLNAPTVTSLYVRQHAASVQDGSK
jgi:UrcA family protein